MIRVGIIGWGENGKDIADALHFRIKGTEVIGISTMNSEGKDYASRKMGLKHIFSTPGQLLELHQIDIICICSEGHEHYQHVEEALRSGSNVFIDQPLASNVEDCRKIQKLADSYPSYKVLVAFPRRYDKKLDRLQKEIAAGKLGDIISIDLETYEPIPMANKEKPESTVHKGIFMDVMLQDIDLVHWLTGKEFKTVYTKGSSKKYPSLNRYDDLDTAHCLATLRDGITVNLKSSRIAHEGRGMRLQITGTMGKAHYSTLDREDALISSQENRPFYLSEIKHENSYLRLIQEYVEAVKGSNRLKYGLSVGTHATLVAVAMTKSHILGNEVSLEE